MALKCTYPLAAEYPGVCLAFDFSLSKVGLMSQPSIFWENQLSVIRTLVVAFFLKRALRLLGCQNIFA